MSNFNYQNLELTPGVIVKTSARAYVSDYWKVGHYLATDGADYEQVMFLHGFMEGMREIPVMQWEYIKRAADERDIDLSELVSLMNEYLGKS